jgi:hypothetical protein
MILAAEGFVLAQITDRIEDRAIQDSEAGADGVIA